MLGQTPGRRLADEAGRAVEIFGLVLGRLAGDVGHGDHWQPVAILTEGVFLIHRRLGRHHEESVRLTENVVAVALVLGPGQARTHLRERSARKHEARVRTGQRGLGRINLVRVGDVEFGALPFLRRLLLVGGGAGEFLRSGVFCLEAEAGCERRTGGRDIDVDVLEFHLARRVVQKAHQLEFVGVDRHGKDHFHRRPIERADQLLGRVDDALTAAPEVGDDRQPDGGFRVGLALGQVAPGHHARADQRAGGHLVDLAVAMDAHGRARLLLLGDEFNGDPTVLPEILVRHLGGGGTGRARLDRPPFDPPAKGRRPGRFRIGEQTVAR